jgi:hypothetical protein
MAAVGKPHRPLHKLHLPVGGRRFRPALEDVLEFLVNEGIVVASTGWKGVLDKSRNEFRERQLRASIARNHEIAADELKACGYRIVPREGKGAVPVDSGGRVFPFTKRKGRRA